MSQGTPGDGHPRRPAGTVLESVEEIRAQINRAAPVVAPPVRPSPGVPPAPVRPATEADSTRPFRPSLRPSMALLTVYDDGEDEGEVLRIRGDRFAIGRVEGDLILSFDSGISGRHAEITRRQDDGPARWVLRDLGSTNGTFIRASTGLLKPGQELLLGSRRFRFDAATPRAVDAPIEAETGRATTQKWQVLTPGPAFGPEPPTLVELTPTGEGPRHRLDQPETWIGRDASRCSIVVDDPMMSPRHAKIVRNDRDQWVVANAQSLNGVWLRVDEVPLGRGGQFRCGEQRFLIKIL